jgi:polyferredoxin
MRVRDNNLRNQLIDLLVLLVCGLSPILLSQSAAVQPRSRYFHIESFRYGKEPATIRCNRGDTLHLSFSSRDTGHSFFLQEFDIDAKIAPSNPTVLQFRASDPQASPVSTDTVVFVAAHPGVLKFLVSKSVFRCHVWCGPMHAFEQGNLVINPNTLLNGGMGLLVGLFLVGRRKGRFTVVPEQGREKDLLSAYPWIRRTLKKPWVMPAIMLAGGLVLYLVVLTTLFGTQVSGRNLGVMLVWIVWLFVLITILTPFGGRLWCMVCPLPALGEALQRRSVVKVRSGSIGAYHNRFFGLQRNWPKWLSNGWPRMIIFLIAGTFSTTLVAQPRATGYAIVLFVLTATVLSLVFKLRSFCMFLCPINSFVGTYAQLGRLSLRKISEKVCADCRGDFCETGSHTGWACPYGLNVRTITTNVDCGMCTECVRSCVYDNVTFRWRRFGNEAVARDVSLGWNAMALLVVGIAYTIVYLGPWPEVRDYVNIIDKDNWGLFAVFAAVLWSIALVIFPLLMYAMAVIARKLSGITRPSFDLMIASTGAVLPLGLFVWVGFIIQMLFVNVTFIEQSLNDPFGWGWNLLGLAGIPWKQVVPRLVPWVQVLCVLIGFAYSQRDLWRIWLDATGEIRTAARGVIPYTLLLLGLGGGLIWFYAA